jgi:transposase
MAMELRRAAFDQLVAEEPAALYAVVQALQQQVVQLTARVAEREARLGQHRQNSHRPPASDAPGVVPRSQRTASGKRPGGQPGHRGHTLAMCPIPDEVRQHHPCQCAQCGADLTSLAPQRIARRQVVDLPPLALPVTEHQAATVCCPHCQQATTAAFPDGVQPGVQYGPQVLGLGRYLRHYQLLPYLRIQETLTDLFGASPGVGTLQTAGLRAAAALAPFATALKAALVTARVLHVDETSLRVAGQRVWVHVASTACWTHYAWHAKRGQAATDTIGILPAFRGWLIHDAWASYWHACCRHGLCNAHLLRDRTAVAEQPGQRWARALHTLLRARYRHVVVGRAAGLTSSPPARLATFLRRYQRILQCGEAANPPPVRHPAGPTRGRLKQSKARNLLDRLRTHAAAVLAFLHDWTVPCDNNQAERDLRMLKVQQKISGTFRDPASADAFCRIRSYVATLRKQGQAILIALTRTLAGQPPRPTLAPE